MTTQKIIGILLIVGGAALFVFGYQASQSVSEQVFETFAGRFTESTTWYLIGGAGLALFGVVLLAVRGGDDA